MSLTEKQKRHLRGLAHQRKPVVIVGGAGLTDKVMVEIENGIAHHELLKVRINADNRSARRDMIEQICAQTHSELVQAIGHTASFYRPAEKPVISLPKY